MRTDLHPIMNMNLGSSHQIMSYHFGDKSNGNKTYIQSSLHADEIPGMLVSHYLQKKLRTLESERQN